MQNLIPDYELHQLECLDRSTTNSFNPKITLPTRFSKKRGTLIDNIYCKLSPATINKRGGIILTDISDHLPCYIAIEKKEKSKGYPKYITVQQQNTKTIAHLVDDLKHADICNELSDDCSPDTNYNHFTSILTAKIKQHMPEKTVRFNKYEHKKELWITTDILNSIKFKDKLSIKLKLLKPGSSKYLDTKNNLDNFKKILKRSIRIAKKEYYFKIFDQCKFDIKKTWSHVNQIITQKKMKKEKMI